MSFVSGPSSGRSKSITQVAAEAMSSMVGQAGISQVQAAVAAVDPTRGLLTGLIFRTLVGVARKVRDKAEDDIGGRLWELVKERLPTKDMDLLAADSDDDDWATQVRDHIEALLVEDPEFADDSERLLFGNGDLVEAVRPLPADHPNFTNRDRELEQIYSILDREPTGGRWSVARRKLFGSTRTEPAKPAVVEIVGPPMIGKTELAVHAAHALADRYPDGCLVIDLGGVLGRSKQVTDGLRDLLRVQGTPIREIPPTRDLALKSYRSWFHQKRVLVVIENAADEDQVATFLPPGESCGAIVTGRRNVASWRADNVCTLHQFSRDSALELLRSIDGSPSHWRDDDLSDARHAPANRVLTWCDWQPAVITTVALWASLPSMADLSDVDIARELTASTFQLAANVPKWSKLQVSMERLYKQTESTSPDTARLFRLLGLLSMPYVDEDLATVLTGRGPDDTRAALRELVDVGALTIDCGSYRMAPYLQRFGERLAYRIDSREQRTTALVRVFRYLLEQDEDDWATSDAAETLDRISQQARQRMNLVAVVVRAVIEVMYEWAVRLALAFSRFFRALGYLGAWEATARTANLAADHIDREETRVMARATTALNLAAALHAQHENPHAADSYLDALHRFRDLTRYALVCAEQGDRETAGRCLATSTELAANCEPTRWPRTTTENAGNVLATVETTIERLHEQAAAETANEANTD